MTDIKSFLAFKKRPACAKTRLNFILLIARVQNIVSGKRSNHDPSCLFTFAHLSLPHLFGNLGLQPTFAHLGLCPTTLSVTSICDRSLLVLSLTPTLNLPRLDSRLPLRQSLLSLTQLRFSLVTGLDFRPPP